MPEGEQDRIGGPCSGDRRQIDVVDRRHWPFPGALRQGPWCPPSSRLNEIRPRSLLAGG